VLTLEQVDSLLKREDLSFQVADEYLTTESRTDPAMGSGSFLVAALRTLTDALYESLHVHGRIEAHGKDSLCRLADGNGTNEITKNVMKRLKFSNDDLAVVKSLVAQHMRGIKAGPKGVRRIMKDLGDLLPQWVDLKRADLGGAKAFSEDADSMVGRFLDKVERERSRVIETSNPIGFLFINGDDIMKLGVKQGPEVGRILKSLQEVVLDDPDKNSKDTLIELAEGLI
jgi:hypothetical protein